MRDVEKRQAINLCILGSLRTLSRAQARTLYKNILSSQIKVLGEAHPAVLDTRYRLASLTALTGDLAAALREYSDLLAKQVDVGAGSP